MKRKVETMKQIKISDVTVITMDELNALLRDGSIASECIDWGGLCEADDGLMYSAWLDTRSGKTFVVRELRTVHFGLNDISESKVKEFVAVVEREGGAEASWGCDGRTRHQLLANQLAEMLPQYTFDIGYNYKCKAYKN